MKLWPLPLEGLDIVDYALLFLLLLLLFSILDARELVRINAEIGKLFHYAVVLTPNSAAFTPDTVHATPVLGSTSKHAKKSP